MKSNNAHPHQALAGLGALLDGAPAAEPRSVLQYKPHGACGRVTGSAHFLRHVPTGRVLAVDFGLIQGEADDAAPALLPVEPAKVDLLLLTHAHIDHIGNLLDFIRAGFAGPILCTRVTAELAVLSLRDSLGRRFRFATDEAAVLEHELSQILDTLPDRFIPLDAQAGVGEPQPLPGFPGVTVALYPTSHVIGAVAFLIRAEGVGELLPAEILFSGDIGPVEDAALHGGLAPARVVPPVLPRVVVLESTYGDRPARLPETLRGGDRIERLASAFGDAVRVHDHPSFVIPTFSLGRTTDVLLDTLCALTRHWESIGLTPRDTVEIHCGSKLSRDYAPIVRDALLGRGKGSRLAWLNRESQIGDIEPVLEAILSPDTQPVVECPIPGGPRVRISWGQVADPDVRFTVYLQSPGAAVGGAVAETILREARNPEYTLILVGYTPPGSIADQLRRIVRAPDADMVDLAPLRHRWGPGQEKVEIPANLVRMGLVDLSAYYSGHADADSLLRYVTGKPSQPDMDVILVHGSDTARVELGRRLMTEHREGRRPVRRVHLPMADYPWFDIGTRQWDYPDLGKLRTCRALPHEPGAPALTPAKVAGFILSRLKNRYYGPFDMRRLESSPRLEVFTFTSRDPADPVSHKVFCSLGVAGVLVRVTSLIGRCQGPESFKHRCFPWDWLRLGEALGYTVIPADGDCGQLIAEIGDPGRTQPLLLVTRVGADNTCARFLSACVLPDGRSHMPHLEHLVALNEAGIPLRPGHALLYLPGVADPIDIDLSDPIRQAPKILPLLNKRVMAFYKEWTSRPA